MKYILKLVVMLLSIQTQLLLCEQLPTTAVVPSAVVGYTSSNLFYSGALGRIFSQNNPFQQGLAEGKLIGRVSRTFTLPMCGIYALSAMAERPVLGVDAQETSPLSFYTAMTVGEAAGQTVADIEWTTAARDSATRVARTAKTLGGVGASGAYIALLYTLIKLSEF